MKTVTLHLTQVNAIIVADVLKFIAAPVIRGKKPGVYVPMKLDPQGLADKVELITDYIVTEVNAS